MAIPSGIKSRSESVMMALGCWAEVFKQAKQRMLNRMYFIKKISNKENIKVSGVFIYNLMKGKMCF